MMSQISFYLPKMELKILKHLINARKTQITFVKYFTEQEAFFAVQEMSEK
eukprot:c16628_g1_i1 orf=108-257(-)